MPDARRFSRESPGIGFFSSVFRGGHIPTASLCYLTTDQHITTAIASHTAACAAADANWVKLNRL